MANDPARGAPQPGGGQKPIVKYALIGGALILAYVLYSRYKNGSSSLGTGTTDTTTAPQGTSFAIDPNTGVPINPTTGQDFGAIGSTGGTLASWTTSAYNALIGQGADPGAVSNALYNYTNGLPLTSAQGGLVDSALGLVGQAPGDLLPFNPAPAAATTTPATAPTTSPVSAVQQFVNSIYAGIHAGGKLLPTAAQQKLAEADVKSGKAKLPQGFTAPKGFVLNPSTRLLSPVKKAA